MSYSTAVMWSETSVLWQDRSQKKLVLVL